MDWRRVIAVGLAIVVVANLPRIASAQKHGSGYDTQQGDDGSGELEALALIGGCFILATPIWGPRVVLENDSMAEGYFPAYPYADGADGSMMIEPVVSAEPFLWMGRASVEYGDSFGDYQQFGAKWLLDTSSRWGVDGSAAYRTQRLPAATLDDWWIGDVNLTYRFAQSSHAQFRTGAGAFLLSKETDNDSGLNLTYAADFYPMQPWRLSFEFDHGLGGAHMTHLRATTGVMMRQGEVFLGVDYLDATDTDATLLISGVRFYY